MRSLHLSVVLAITALALPEAGHAGQSLDQIELELARNRALWNAFGDADYEYRMQRSCFCFPEFVAPGVVTVRADEISEVRAPDEFQFLDPAHYLTIEGLFDVIQDAIDLEADVIGVVYDGDLGYPSVIDIDYIAPSVDDEIRYTASDMVLGTGFEDEQEVLDEATAAWQENGISHYQFVLETGCFCPPEVTAPGLVEVNRGAIVSVVDPDTGIGLDPANYRSVTDLFDVVQNAIDQEVFQLTAAYDPLGYPAQIFVDPVEFLADDTTAYMASDLVDLPEPRAQPLAIAVLAALQWLARFRRAGHAPCASHGQATPLGQRGGPMMVSTRPGSSPDRRVS